MITKWPGETTIMDEWEWKRSEAPTTEFGRPASFPVYYPVAADTADDGTSWIRVLVYDNGDFLFPIEWHVQIWSNHYQKWEDHPGRYWAFPGDTYGMKGFGWSHHRCLRKALRKANGVIKLQNRRQKRYNESVYVANL